MGRYKKERKLRTIKKSGEESMDMCEGCFAFNCDPMGMPIEWQSYVSKCRRENRCVGCGKLKEECICKSSLGARKQHISNRQRLLHDKGKWERRMTAIKKSAKERNEFRNGKND